MKNFLPGAPATPCFEAPRLDRECAWQSVGGEETPFELAGKPGTLRRKRFHSSGLTLEVEAFTSADGVLAGFRSALRNGTEQPVAVGAVYPFAAAVNPEGALYHCGKRLKNDKPYSAVYQGEPLAADPVLLFARRGVLRLIGWLDQDRHPAMIRLADKRLLACAEYNGQLLPPGESLTTQWCAFRTGSEYNRLLADHAAAVLSFYPGAGVRKAPPFVISSWHYFGLFLDEKVIEAELAAIRARQIPCDVYQLDAGWYADIGDWRKTNERFPSGIVHIARSVKEAGFTPGIWLSPFMISLESETAKAHPEWFLRDSKGEVIPFRVSRPCGVLDLSRPEVIEWIESVLRSLYDAGFRYFKADFTRCVFVGTEDAVPHDRRVNLLAGYRRGMEAVRRGIGPGAFLNVCGGHCGGIIGLADSQRTGNDTYARWLPDDPTPAWQRIGQGMFRAWMGAWRYNDPDAAAIRLSGKTLGPGEHGSLSLGDMTDGEAEIMVLHQFLAGGVPALGECVAELQEERLRMMRRVIPSPGKASRLLDPFNPVCPSRFALTVDARAGVSRHIVYSALNLAEEPEDLVFRLTPDLCAEPAKEYLVADLSRGTVLGVFTPGGRVVPPEPLEPHTARVFAVIPVTGRRAFPVMTGGHYAMLELERFEAEGAAFHGKASALWPYPIRLTVALPLAGGGWDYRTLDVESGASF